MENIPLTNRQSIVKAFVVWILGLVVLFGWTAITLALPKDPSGTKRYCHCECENPNTHQSLGEIYWDFRFHCNTNGQKCKKGGQTGTLRNCMEACWDAPNQTWRSYGLCTGSMQPPGRVLPPLAPQPLQPVPGKPVVPGQPGGMQGQ